MKNQFVFLFCIMALMLSTGCEIAESLDEAGELKILKDGEVILDLSDIDYYDFSAHIFYLNESNRLNGDFDKLEGASVVVDGIEIYSLRIQEMHSSAIYPGAQINRMMDIFGDFAFRIRFVKLDDGSGNSPADPRIDPNIRNVLKAHGKLREGLSIEIVSVEKSGTDIKAILRLKNLDPISYYHLDPGKMGNALFHYFTNGLTFYNPEIPHYVYDQTIGEAPEPWNYWTNDWLAEIGGNQSKVFEFSYNLGTVPKGEELDFFFDFPSPHFAITSRADLNLKSGTVWLGTVHDLKTVTF